MVKVKRTIKDYEDIIYLPHHVSKKRAQMPISDRAAQFAPFSAVVGHEAAIKDTARHTEKRKKLDETEKAIISDKLRKICEWLPEEHEVSVVYFEPDMTKRGGQYLSKTGVIKKINVYNQYILFADGTKIKIEEIYSIEL